MNVVYLKHKSKTKPSYSYLLKVPFQVIGMVLAVVFSPVIAIVCFSNQLRCDHIWIPKGEKENCVRCNKHQNRKELLGLERL